jgi:hypothetical protein
MAAVAAAWWSTSMDKFKDLPLTTESHKHSIAGWAIAVLLAIAIGCVFGLQEMSPEAKYGQHCQLRTVGHVVCLRG